MQRNWTRDELILVYNGYCKIPYGRFNNRSLEVKVLSEIIGRSPGAIAFKLVNFVSLDPKQKELGRKGASNIGKLDKQIFQEFQDDFDRMYLKSEALLELKIRQKLIDAQDNEILHLKNKKEGKTIFITVKGRKNQDYFRVLVLNNYSHKCAVTGISIPSLLIASHIKPWSIDRKNRLNPHNGLCLSATFDKAFDRGLITLNEDYKIIFSATLKSYEKEEFYKKEFVAFEGKQIILPIKFLPKAAFIQYHNNEIFKG